MFQLDTTPINVISFFQDNRRGLAVSGLPYDAEFCPLMWAQIRRSLRDLWQVDFLGLFREQDDKIIIILHANMACVESFEHYKNDEAYLRQALEVFHRGDVAKYCEKIFKEISTYLNSGFDWPDAIDLVFPERPVRKKKEAEEAARRNRKSQQNSHGAYWLQQTEALA